MRRLDIAGWAGRWSPGATSNRPLRTLGGWASIPAAQSQGNRLRWGWIPARALLCLMGDLEISEVGHGGGGIEAVLDRPFLGAEGPAPSLEGDLSAAGDPASGALRDAGGGGGVRSSPALGRGETGISAPGSAAPRRPF